MSASRRLLGGIAAAVLVAVLALPATAHHTDLVDPDDTNGRFDIETVELAHDADRGRWYVSTFLNWSLKAAWDQGFVLVYLDTNGNEDVDFYALIYSNGRKLSANLYRDKPSGKDPKVGALPATKSDGRTASVKITLEKVAIGDGRTEWYWSTQTLFTGADCKKVCMDLAPDAGMVTQLVEVPLAPSPGTPASTHELTATPNPEDIDLPQLP